MTDSPFANIPETKPERPTIITVFAIFTIIGCAFSMLSVFIPTDLFTRGLDSAPPTPPQWIAFVAGALALLKLLGALQMLQMKRLGFFMYAAGETASAVLTIISARITIDLLSGMNIPGPIDMELILIFTTGFNLLMSVLFIAVYGSQLKKMT
jgi:hypothetical protein